MRGFVAPTAIPIKKTPSINDIIGETPFPMSKESIVVQEISKTTEDKVDKETPPVEKPEDVMPNAKLEPTPSVKQEKKDNDGFGEHWKKMFEIIYHSDPIVYFALKDTIPSVENNIIKVIVKNEVQKEHFELKMREVLEYMRTHFDEKLEDLSVFADEKLEVKKIIYDERDKLLNFKAQSEEFDDFLQILDIKIKV